MATDYFVAICIRYGVLLAAGVIAQGWVLPHAWTDPVSVGVVLYWLVIIQTEPAARYARRAPRPWAAWVVLAAAPAHAFSAAMSYALTPAAEPRFEHPGGILFVPLWVNDPSLVEVGSWIVLYALFSAAWAVLIGAMARACPGALPPDQPVLRIRRRPHDPPSTPAGEFPAASITPPARPPSTRLR